MNSPYIGWQPAMEPPDPAMTPDDMPDSDRDTQRGIAVDEVSELCSEDARDCFIEWLASDEAKDAFVWSRLANDRHLMSMFVRSQAAHQLIAKMTDARLQWLIDNRKPRGWRYEP